MKSPDNESNVHHSNYLFGFALALVLTILAFGLVIVGAGVPFGSITSLFGFLHYGHISMGEIPHQSIMIGIFILAFVQILVHLRYFLHLGFSPSQRWNTLTIFFTLLIIIIMAGGTLWIIFSLNTRLMPGTPDLNAY
jgi:cytochrome o ubiquinol oxidase operon protein cyoD